MIIPQTRSVFSGLLLSVRKNGLIPINFKTLLYLQHSNQIYTSIYTHFQTMKIISVLLTIFSLSHADRRLLQYSNVHGIVTIPTDIPN
eukprot:99509_1